MRRLLPKALLLAGLSCAAISPVSLAAAQQAETSEPQGRALRPLSWSGRPSQGQIHAPSAPMSQSTQARPQVIPRGGYQINPPIYSQAQSLPPGRRQGLTPASAFYAGPAPQPLPVPGYNAPVYVAPPPPPPPPAPVLIQPSPPERVPTLPAYDTRVVRPSMTPRGPEIAPAPPPSPAPHPSTPPPPEPLANDPMAPRRDAPIFRIAPNAPPTPVDPSVSQPTPQSPSVAASGANSQSRYYSVHRQYGRQPDPTPTPPPIYLDALPVDVTGMAGSSDLAEPPAPPTLIRNTNGRIQALPDLGDDGP